MNAHDFFASDPAFSLFVPGIPSPAGSKKAVPVFNKYTRKFVTAANGRPIVAVMDAAKGSRAWKDRISALAVDHWKSAPLDEPLSLLLVFTMARPKAHFGKRKGAPYLKDDAPRWHVGAPDTTKLTRAVEDALNGLVWRDDSRVVKQQACKQYGDAPGVRIEVRRLAS